MFPKRSRFRLALLVLVAGLQLGTVGCTGGETNFQGLMARGRKKQTMHDEFKNERRQARKTDKEFRERKRMETMRKKDARKIRIDVARRDLERKKLDKEKRVFEKRRVGL